MKVLPLVLADLKGFLRDWRSIALLVLFPLLIVSLIFASFQPGDSEFSVGLVENVSDNKSAQIESKFSQNVSLNSYDEIDSCISDISEYRLYGCISVQNKSDGLNVKLFYDNTRRVARHAFLTKVKSITRDLEANYTAEEASIVLKRLENRTEEIEGVQEDINETKGALNQSKTKIDTRIEELEVLRSNFTSNLQEMNSKKAEVEEDLVSLRETNSEIYLATQSSIDSALAIAISLDLFINDEEIEDEINELRDLLRSTRDDVDVQNQEVSETINSTDQLLEDYETFNSNSESYLERFNDTIDSLREYRADIASYQKNLSEVSNRLERIQSNYRNITRNDPRDLLNKIGFEGLPLFGSESELGEKWMPPEQSNLLALQTVYSIMLVSVTMFVALLVSMYITLKQINSDTQKRISIISKTYLPEYISLYLSSMAIITVPILSVFLFGQFVFQLPIISQGLEIGFYVFLLSSAIVNFGMATALLIRKSSITLLLGSFILVFLIYFSGIALPLESMRPIAKSIALLMPGTVTIELFNLSVLYNQPPSDVLAKIIVLMGWNIATIAAALSVKSKVRKKF